MNDEFELVRGSHNPLRDLGIPDADTELMKAGLASSIIRIMRERNMSATDAARAAEVAVADISRIRKAALDCFTIVLFRFVPTEKLESGPDDPVNRDKILVSTNLL